MAMFGAKGGSIAGFNGPQPGISGTAGLIGDVLTGTNTTKTRLDDDFNFAQQQYAAQHPNPMNVGGNLVASDGQGGYKAVYSAPQQPTGYAAELVAAGYPVGSAMFNQLAQQKAQNEATAPPIVQHNADGTTTLYQSGAIPRGPSNLPPIGSTIADPRQTGGAAPAMGPGGFPFYRPGH